MTSRTLRILTLSAFGILVAAAGCGKAWNQNESVEGTVTLDGSAVPNAVVEFIPDDPKIQGPSSTGTTDEKGHFQLTCSNNKPGAVIGKHNVVVRTGRSDTGKPLLAIPLVYTIADKTPATAEVTADNHTYPVNLTRSASARQ